MNISRRMLIFLTCLSMAVGPSYAWLRETVLDDDRLLMLYWTVDVKKNVLLLEVQVQTGGYIGIGLSPDGTMQKADIMVGYVDSSGRPHVCDYWARGNGDLQTEKSQDWKVLHGHQNSTHTMLRVRRPLTTEDSWDVVIKDYPHWVIWAWHPDDPEEGQLPQYHQERRGAKRICLIRPDCAPSENTGANSLKKSGVPQGTLLGLILFITFVNFHITSYELYG